MITLYVLHAENYGNIFFKKMGLFLKKISARKCTFGESCCQDGNTKYINHAARINLYRDT